MRDKLLAILEEIRPDVDFENENLLVDGGVLDSFDIISIAADLNENFDIEIDVEELEPYNFNTVDAMLALIEKLSN